MKNTLHIELPDRLRQFVEKRSGAGTPFESAEAYICDLIRRDFECDEGQRWENMLHQLKMGMTAEESDFVDFDPQAILDEVRKGHAHSERMGKAK